MYSTECVYVIYSHNVFKKDFKIIYRAHYSNTVVGRDQHTLTALNHRISPFLFSLTSSELEERRREG